MSKFSEKFKEEFLALLPPTLFFFVALNLIALIRALMLKGTGIPVSTPLQVGPRKLRAMFFGAPATARS